MNLSITAAAFEALALPVVLVFCTGLLVPIFTVYGLTSLLGVNLNAAISPLNLVSFFKPSA